MAKKSDIKPEVSDAITIERYIDLKGGICALDRSVLIKKFQKELKTPSQWKDVLVKLTVVQK